MVGSCSAKFLLIFNTYHCPVTDFRTFTWSSYVAEPTCYIKMLICFASPEYAWCHTVFVKVTMDNFVKSSILSFYLFPIPLVTYSIVKQFIIEFFVSSFSSSTCGLYGHKLICLKYARVSQCFHFCIGEKEPVEIVSWNENSYYVVIDIMHFIWVGSSNLFFSNQYKQYCRVKVWKQDQQFKQSRRLLKE